MGGLYNLIRGYSPACVLLMPMLGRTENQYPRFRDCFLSEDESKIVIYTRVGGKNRGLGYGEEELIKDPNFFRTYDDDYDNTYGYYEFNVPEQWSEDFKKIIKGDLLNVSDEYVSKVKEIFPLLDSSGVIDHLFRMKKEDAENGETKDSDH